jgi:pimeloyl-ACP methyl ester carboxylesterase
MEFEDLYFNAPDGLRLHALAAGTGGATRLPAICLPGLARTAEDFREVMQALGNDARSPRRVFALDSRGRGKSERDPNPANYSVPVELADLLAVLTAAGIERAIFIGTSRGGILTMALTAARKNVIAGAVLNDIGPVLDMAGLLRIKGYVGKLPKPASMADAAALLKRTLGSQFPGLSDDEWRLYARRSFVETAAGIEVNYDPKISTWLKDIDASVPAPTMWPLFDGLAQARLMLIRGEHSDLLSLATAAEMRTRRPDMELVAVPGQGHAPLLADRPTVTRIRNFAVSCDKH